MKKLLHEVSFMIAKVIYSLFFITMKLFRKPCDNCVAFISIPDYADNARVFSEYLESKGTYHIYWCVENVEKCMKNFGRKNVTFLSAKKNRFGRYSLFTYFNIYKCKYLFYTHISVINKRKKSRSQIIVNLWHGCGYKDCEVKNVKNVTFDYALVPGELFVDIKSTFWGASKNTVLPLGYPRYDLFFSQSRDCTFLEKFRVNDTTKIVVWMPTFRKSEVNNYPENDICYQYDLPLVAGINDLKRLDETCDEQNITLVIKRHPFQKEYSFEKSQFKRIKIISNEYLENIGVQLYELLPYTDALISDYSSISIDYILLNKPIAFSLDDFDKYKRVRGFVFENPLEYMPGHHLFDFKDLIAFLQDVCVNNDLYKDSRQKMISLMHNPCSNYCKRLCDYLKI